METSSASREVTTPVRPVIWTASVATIVFRDLEGRAIDASESSIHCLASGVGAEVLALTRLEYEEARLALGRFLSSW